MPSLVTAVTCWIAGLLVAAMLPLEQLQTRLAARMPPQVTTPPAMHSATHSAMHAALKYGLVLAVVCTLVMLLAKLFARFGGAHVATRAAVIAILPPALIFISALLIGTDYARRQNTCLGALALQHEFRLAIDSRVHAGGHTTAQVVGTRALASCRASASLHVEGGAAPAGAIVNVTGSARRTDRGLLVSGTLTATGQTDQLRVWRGRAGEQIDTLFRKNAPLVRALLIADQSGLSPEMRDRFADAGLVHMLSISGLHVAIIAEALLIIARASRLPTHVANAAALIAVIAYVITLGAPPPAVRSAVMLAVVALTEQMQRPVHPWTALALGAVIPTVQPDVVVDLGWQLSVAGMAALVAAGAVRRRLRTIEVTPIHGKRARQIARAVRDLRGWRSTLFREVLTGVVATIVTAPLIAWTFGRISIVAPLSNIAAGPLVAVIQPALFLALLLTPWPGAARLVADATALPIAMFDHVATWWAAVPLASIHVAPTLASACCAGIAAIAFVRTTASRNWTRGLLLSAGALVAAVWVPLLVPANGELEMHVLDVGQGDAIALRTPKGRWVLVDAGRRWDGGDAGRRVVVPYIQRRGGAVAAFILSHAHDDHVGGATSVLQALHPARWWEPAFITANETYRASLAEVRAEHIPWERVHPGEHMQLDGVAFDVLAPDSAWTAAQENANETSVIVRVQYGGVVYLLTGDAEANEEAWVLQHTDPRLLHADVLKLGHHGSRTSSTAPFLDAVHPTLGVVSVGEGNRYGHPSPETLDAFAARGIPLRRTDRDGSIVVATDGRRITVTDQHDRWLLTTGAPDRVSCDRAALAASQPAVRTRTC